MKILSHSFPDSLYRLEANFEKKNCPFLIILSTKKRKSYTHLQNHFYCLPVQAKLHQGGDKTEAISPLMLPAGGIVWVNDIREFSG